MITSTQAQQYLSEILGVSVPSFIVDAAIATVATTESAMIAAGYDDNRRMLIQTYAVVIISCAGGARRISSQTAPSGASRSFKNDDKLLTQLRRTLAALDTAGIVTALVGPDPALGGTMLMVVG